MPYRLRAEENEIQVTKEGPFEFKFFRHGEIYPDVPEEERHRFEEIGTDAQPEE